MTFSENQVRQFYTANALKTTGQIVSTDAIGTIAVNAKADKSVLYFTELGAGGVVRSDLIDVANIMSAKATDASTLQKSLKRYKLTLDSTVNSGDPVAGQDYILNLFFREFIGISPEDTYNKFGVVYALQGMTPSVFYATMAVSIVTNMLRESNPLIKTYLETGGTSTTVGTLVEVTKADKVATLTGTYTGIVFEAVEQPWELGVYQEKDVNFSVIPSEITTGGTDVSWGTVVELAPANFIKDGKIIADLEYFLMGERGDIYRNVGFPNVIHTKYLVDSTIEYNTIDIHYFFSDSNESVQKSEKTITLAIPKVGADNSVSNVLTNSIISAINTKAGLSIPTLDITKPNA